MNWRLMTLLVFVGGMGGTLRAACDGTGVEKSNCGATALAGNKWSGHSDANCKKDYFCSLRPNLDTGNPTCQSCWFPPDIPLTTTQQPKPLAPATKYYCHRGEKRSQNSTLTWKLINPIANQDWITGKDWNKCFEQVATNFSYHWKITSDLDGKNIMCGRCGQETCGPCTIAS